MSLLWADDFETYGVGGHSVSGSGRDYALQGCYVQFGNAGSSAGCALVADPDPFSDGGSVVRFVPQGGAGTEEYSLQLRKVLPSAKTTVGMFARLWWASFAPSTENGPMIRFADSSNVTNIYLQVTPIGSIQVFRGTIGGTLTSLGTSAAVLTASAWHHIEAKVLFSQTVGTVAVYVNGEQVLDLTNQDTVNGSVDCQNVSLCQRATGTAAGGNTYWKDFVVYDTLGTYNNDIMGTCLVERFTVTSDVSFNWTPSTGTTGYDLIDEAGPNDLDYISADVTETTESEFGVENLPTDVTSIRGMILLGRLRASDGGDCKVQMGVKSNGVQGLGTDRQITTAYTYWHDVVETSPDTGVPFTPAEFNAMTFTIDRTV